MKQFLAVLIAGGLVGLGGVALARTGHHGRSHHHTLTRYHVTVSHSRMGKMNGRNSMDTPASHRRRVTPAPVISNNGQSPAGTGSARETTR